MTTVGAMATKRQAIVRPFLVACLLAFGAGTVLAVFVLWLVAIADQWSRDEAILAVVVRDDGTPLLTAAGRGFQTYYTLEGKRLSASDSNRLGVIRGTWLPLPRADSWQPFPLDRERERVWLAYGSYGGEELWYFVHDGRVAGSCYFVGFDRRTKYCLGYLSAHGFQEGEPREQDRIPLDLREKSITREYRQDGKVSLASENRLIEVDFFHRTVRTLMTADQRILSHAIHTTTLRDPPFELSPKILQRLVVYAVRLSDRVVVLEEPKLTQRERTFLLPPEVRDSSFFFYFSHDFRNAPREQALLVRSRHVMDDTRCDMDWIDPAGKIVRHEETVFPRRSIFDKPTKRPWISTAAISSPVLTVPLAPFLGANLDERLDYFAAYSAGFPYAWLPCTLAMIAAFVLACLCFRRQKHYAQAWTAVWVAFVLLGGLPAWLAYRWHRRWPVLAACPACGQLAPRDRLHCAHCGAEFPVPQAKGIEVFAA